MTTSDVPANASGRRMRRPPPGRPRCSAWACCRSRRRWRTAGRSSRGSLYWLAFPGVDAGRSPSWRGCRSSSRCTGRRPAATMLLGWVAGITMNVAGFCWLQKMLTTFSGFPAPLCFLFLLIVCAFQGGRIALLGWLYGRATARGWPYAPVFAGAFVASELLYPVLFPWYFAATVHQVPVLTQLADVGGPILRRPRARRGEPRARRGDPRASPSGAGSSIGVARRRERSSLAFACVLRRDPHRAVDAATQAAPEATVGVVQANMGLMEKRSSFDEGLRRHLNLSAELRARRHVDFVVWSETSAMRPVRDATYTAGAPRGSRAASACRRSSAPSSSSACPTSARYVLYNSAVASDAAGTITGRYDKQVPRSPSASTCPSARRSRSSTGGRPTAGTSRPGPRSIRSCSTSTARSTRCRRSFATRTSSRASRTTPSGTRTRSSSST